MSSDLGGRELHLSVHPVAAGHHPGAWRWPGADPLAFSRIEGYLEVAQVAERGRLDSIFLADVPGLHADIDDYPQLNGLEPTLILTAMAVVTERIGLVGTASTTFNEPFNIARRFRALDLISHGRAGWNAVTTSGPRVAGNFVADEPSSRARYAKAEEFVAIVLDLWRSWAPDALAADVASGLYADMSRIRPIDHHGEFFSVRGPLSLPPSEQGYPVLYHAGVSDDVRTLTARTGEAMFTAVVDIDTARAELDVVRSRAVAFGRPADAVRFLPGLVTSVGGTEREALERRQALDELSGTRGAVRGLAAQLGLNPDDLELDRPVPPALRGRLHAVRGHARPAARRALEGQTVRDIIRRGGGGGHVVAVGDPEQIADLIQTWFTAGVVDGFTLMPDVTFDGLPAFVDHVVPVLRRRGLFRSEYRGRTLREHYGLPIPDVATRRPLAKAL
ncbi:MULTISPECIES: NtaA/DmoA family FMN-dependent monooxygenase [Protofrankia]|uniref:FMN-dependent oxidoreductase, nitrilotriacetate monooxygenase family n=1 Tax=Candidatus Protofrankia datiscae TaxID=2716812 RepID=F8AWM3_9ACTN|nr:MULTISPECIES: NtaA/DmoA family FMN-dependent monooxygenase [Protofrankia]AEH09360.1 FMN-dependent oxidoreductase, nitrilotriacetate monooxygenase family [Candidatus Protofrankia datiscae]